MANLAKYRRPRLAQVQPRERLFAQLDACRLGAATWVCGPPGAGKTTLAASYLDARPQPALWYQVDPGDADPAAFFADLGASAVESTLYGGAPLPHLTPDCLADLEGFARRWARLLFGALPGSGVVVLDNLHEAGGALDAALRAMVEQVPPGLHLLLVSRTEPPPSLARARASRALAVLDWPDLRFTPEEALAIVPAGPRAVPDVQALIERADGWAAGLILLLDHAQATGRVGHARPSHEVLFDYFASELFDRLPEATRHLLLRTALLPSITAPMARALAGTDDALAVLEALHRHHLFIERRGGQPPSYQLHALLREFLLDVMQRTLPESERRQLERLSGEQLLEAGEHAAAVRLFLQAGAAEPALRLVLTHAPALLEQGRVQTLSEWAQAVAALLPAPVPWLDYWRGACEFLAGPARARAHWQAAFAGFEACGDTLGEVMAAAGIIDSHIIEYRWFEPVDPWSARLLERLESAPAFPHPQLELMALTSLVSALVMRRPQQRLSLPFAERARALLPLVASINVRVMCAARLLLHDVFMGESSHSVRLIEDTRAWLAEPALPPLTVCNWHNIESLHFELCDYDGQRAGTALQSALDVAERHGLRFLRVLLRARLAMVLLESSDIDGARRQLALAPPAPEDESFDAEWSRAIGGWIALLSGDAPAAAQAMRRLVAFNVSMGITTSYGMALAFEANALLACGDAGAATAVIEEYRKPHVPRTPAGEFTFLLIEADVALVLGDAVACEQALRLAFAKGRDQRILNTLQWLPAQMSRLCAFALQRDIERAFVLELIRVRQVPPPRFDDPACEAWPWPLKIRCLGRFEVLVNGQPLRFDGKAQRKPLALLKALVAMGGQEVPIDALIEALWGESLRGDERKAFDITLHRVRKLLGNGSSIRVADHKVSLAPDLAWVDLHALQRTLQRLLPAGPAAATNGAELERAAPQVLHLYGGPLLADEPAADWLRAERQRVSSRFVRFAAALGAHWEQAAQWTWALRLYERCIELEPSAEVLHHRLAVCRRRERSEHLPQAARRPSG